MSTIRMFTFVGACGSVKTIFLLVCCCSVVHVYVMIPTDLDAFRFIFNTRHLFRIASVRLSALLYPTKGWREAI